MRYMTGRYMVPGRLTMALLIIKKHICIKRLQKLPFVQTAQKQGLIDSNIPCSQGPDDTLMSRCSPCSDQASTNRDLASGKDLLNLLHSRQERFKWAAA